MPLAHLLYHSLHERLLTLPDDVRVYPTHGAGSFCTTSTCDRRVTTIGNERWNNPLALAASKEEFLERAMTGLGSYPPYFRHLREVNRKGASVLEHSTPFPQLTPSQVQTEVARGAVIIDLRSPIAYATGHLTGSYGIPFISPFIRWVGWVVPFGSSIGLVSDDANERAAAVQQLRAIGFDDLCGYMDGVRDGHKEGLPLARTDILPQADLRQWLSKKDKPLLLDVRFADEYREGHLPGAHHIEAGALTNGATRTLPTNRPIVIYFRSGNRATVGYSLLERRGFQNVVLLESGYAQWQASSFETVRF